jgi:choline dehydrogenase-like flavoprotein
MKQIFIVGSGASAVHFTLSALKKGHKVTMLDVGYRAPGNVKPGNTFNQLKCDLKDPAYYFLGDHFESVVPPDYDKEIYGFPPNKQYIFKHPPGFKETSTGFEPLFSFAQGGLAEAWTGGSYPFDDNDMKNFPFNYKDIEPYYEEMARRIGVIGVEDDLSRYFPLHKNLLPGLQLDEHSQLLVENYEKKRNRLNEKYGIYMGRNRMAVLSSDRGERKACDYSGRCLWGCPTHSLYVPSLTLNECLDFPGFTYIPNRLVTHFKYNSNKRVTTIVTRSLEDNKTEEYKVEYLVLAAGTLSSTMIYLESLYRQTGEIIKLHGLMDNRQILVPFINLKMVGKHYNPESYQYHQLAIGLHTDDNDGKDYIHGQVTTLKTALMQPVLQTMPLDWKTAIFLGRNLHAALGVININYSDTRREGNYITLQPLPTGSDGLSTAALEIHYTPPPDEKRKIANSIKKIKKFMSGLGVLVLSGQSHIRPMGASVHYSGTLPMSPEPKPHTLSPTCRSHELENLYFVDGTSFPFLPAKNLTFTLMANAVRVADKEF